MTSTTSTTGHPVPRGEWAERAAPGTRSPGPLRFLTLLKPLLYALALVLPPVAGAAAGVALKLPAIGAGAPPALGQALPAPPPHDPAKRTAVVIAGTTGTEGTDFLVPYEVLARSGAFNVYAVAPERTPLPLVNSNMAATGLEFVPHYAFAEYDAAIGRAPDLLVIPWFPGYTPQRDAALLEWVRAHAGPETVLLTICAGTEVLADTGLLDGHTATTNTGWFAKLGRRLPTVTWVRGVRYVDDGAVITSSNVAAGLDATLHAVARLAGRAVAEDVARQLGYRYTRYLDDPAFRPPSMMVFVPWLANAAFTWGRQDLGVLLYDGVSELALAGLLDPYGSSLVARTHAVAPERAAVRSRHGLTLVPRDDARTAPPLERVVLPAGDATGALRQALTAWGAARPEPEVEAIHRDVGAGGSAYDATLDDLARTQNGVVAAAMGRALNYPVEHLRFADAAWPVAPVLAPAALGLLGAGLVYAVDRLGRARAARPRLQPA